MIFSCVHKPASVHAIIGENFRDAYKVKEELLHQACVGEAIALGD